MPEWCYRWHTSNSSAEPRCRSDCSISDGVVQLFVNNHSPGTGFLQCFDTVGLVIWPVKIVPEMTYYVSSGTLSPSHCTGTVKVDIHHATAQEAILRLCRSKVIQTNFLLIYIVQSSWAYNYLFHGRPSVCILDTPQYWDGHAECTKRYSVSCHW